jgi:hypothetical protein
MVKGLRSDQSFIYFDMVIYKSMGNSVFPILKFDYF